MFRPTAILLAAIQVLLAAPAGAEEPATAKRTPQAAQEFLRVVLPGTRLKLNVYESATTLGPWNGREVLPSKADREKFLRDRVSFKVSTVSAGEQDICWSTLSITGGAVYIHMPGYVRSNGTWEPFDFARKEAFTKDLLIEWDKIPNVTVSGSNVSFGIKIGDEMRSAELTFDSADIGVRTGYAMEFLRAACDPAAKTGF